MFLFELVDGFLDVFRGILFIVCAVGSLLMDDRLVEDEKHRKWFVVLRSRTSFAVRILTVVLEIAIYATTEMQF